MTKQGIEPYVIGSFVDSLSVCLSKGLGNITNDNNDNNNNNNNNKMVNGLRSSPAIKCCRTS